MTFPRFKLALPVWPAGCGAERNATFGFTVGWSIESRDVQIAVAAGSLYRVFCNGAFVGYGPARAAHGYARVDVWPLDSFVRPGANFLAIEVAGYNVPSFYVLNEPPFLQAEILAGGQVLAATGAEGRNGFQARRLRERVQRVQRYSYQRPFTEVYRLTPNFADWRRLSNIGSGDALPLEIRPTRRLLARGVGLPSFAVHPAKSIACGRSERRPQQGTYWKDRSLLLSGTALGGFREDEMEALPSLEAQDWATVSLAQVESPPTLELKTGDFALYDLGRNLSGFIQATLSCPVRSRLFLSFDEILSEGDIDFHRLDCVNLITYDLAPGDYALDSFEAYTCRYLKLLVLEGQLSVGDVALRAYENPEIGRATFETPDESLTAIFRAAEATYAQNTVDLLMDCPSRERAGWLNDSFFSGRSAFLFSGNTRVENNFLENFAQAPPLPDLPPGMIPMCYPADSIEGGHTPNLPCWLICELEEMRARGGDEKIIASFRPKVEAYFRYLETFLNKEGLLENVPGWIFIEWSKANEWTQDVNIPFNLLFSDALAAAAVVYGISVWKEQADMIRGVVHELAFDGTYFQDHLIRKGGDLHKIGHSSEICQYHAFWSGIATPERNQQLWKTLVETCGPLPETPNLNDLEPANMIMGRYLRFDLLAKFGEHPRLLSELKATFAPMAEKTGTLWEHLDHRASCNHGLAAHAAVSLVRDIAGIAQINVAEKTIAICLHNLPLSECRARHPLAVGHVELRWKVGSGQKLHYEVRAPEDYRVAIDNRTGLELIETTK